MLYEQYIVLILRRHFLLGENFEFKIKAQLFDLHCYFFFHPIIKPIQTTKYTVNLQNYAHEIHYTFFLQTCWVHAAH